MDRREFIKLSALFSAAISLEPSPIYRMGIDFVNNIGEFKILIFSIETIDGVLKLKVSKNTSMDNIRISSNSFNVDSFKILEIVNESLVNQKKLYWHNKLEIQGHCYIYNREATTRGSKKLVEKLKKNNFYTKERMSKWARGGAIATEKKLRASGELDKKMDNLRNSVTEEGKQKSKESFIKNAIKWGKSEENKKICSEMGKKYGSINGSKYLKSRSEKEIKKHASLGGLGGGAKKSIEKGTHNFLKQSPNNIKWVCPDGHISSSPNYKNYCKHRGLDYTKAIKIGNI